MINDLRVVIDTNILISGLLGRTNAPSSHILQLMRTQQIMVVTSPFILEEVAEVINRERIVKLTHMDQQTRKSFIEELLARCSITEGNPLLLQGSRDNKDNKFLACAVEGSVNYIISGDDDLLVLKEFEGIKIVTPREFLEFLKNN